MFLDAIHPSLLTKKKMSMRPSDALIVKQQTCRSMELSSVYLITLSRCVAPSLNYWEMLSKRGKSFSFYAYMNEKRQRILIRCGHSCTI